MENKDATAMSTGRRVWLWTAVVISAIILVLVVGGIVGTWIGRSVAIDVADGLLDGVSQVAQVGRDGAARLDTRIGELRTVVGDVETAVDEVAQNVDDKGLLLTLLPPEKEQKLVNTAETVGEVVESVRSVVVTAVELWEAVDSLPLVSLPKPDAQKAETLQTDIAAVRADVDQMAADIQAFRSGTADTISTVSEAAGQVDGRLAQSEQTLTQVDSDLEALQARTVELKQQFRTWTAVLAVVLTLLLAWVAYALVMLIQRHWADLQAG